MYEFKNGPKGDYLFVDCADIDGDGLPEIYVSNRLFESTESFVLEWRKGGPRIKAKGHPLLFRSQPNPLARANGYSPRAPPWTAPSGVRCTRCTIKTASLKRAGDEPADTAMIFNFVLSTSTPRAACTPS